VTREGIVRPCGTLGLLVDTPGQTLDDAIPRPADSDARTKSQSSLRSAVEWVLIVAGAVLVAIVIRTFVLQAFYIPSSSMEPTLKINDKVLVNKLSYKFHDINRGDIVVFERPPGETDPKIKDLIKRVIGLPGDSIEAHDGHVFVDGRLLKEPYLPVGLEIKPLARQTVPSNSIFVMGDNRPASKDSTVFGPISKKLVVGRAFLRVWPLSAINFL
jgi:signal peptidase I